MKKLPTPKKKSISPPKPPKVPKTASNKPSRGGSKPLGPLLKARKAKNIMDAAPKRAGKLMDSK